MILLTKTLKLYLYINQLFLHPLLQLLWETFVVFFLNIFFYSVGFAKQIETLKHLTTFVIKQDTN